MRIFAVGYVRLKGCNFSWKRDDYTPLLTNINLTVNPGGLVAVVGGVGSGKSSLLNGILGEMEKTEGDLSLFVSLCILTSQLACNKWD